MENYVYESMWAEDTKDYNGTYDVDDSVTAFIRTTGPAITVNGAWARNIGVNETFIDFLGDKAGIRLTYGGNFTIYGTKDGKLYSETPEFTATSHFQNEIDAFVECIETNANIAEVINVLKHSDSEVLFYSKKFEKFISELCIVYLSTLQGRKEAIKKVFMEK